VEHELITPIAPDLGMARCIACGFAFVNPRPTRELVRRFYDAEDYVCHEHVQPDFAETRLFDDLLGVLRETGGSERRKLLDYGCGGGVFVRHARRRGWDASGYDVGGRARTTCESLRLPFFSSAGELAGQRFDFVVLSHVLEHVESFDALFAVLDTVVHDDTLLYMEAPNVRSLRARLTWPALTRHLRFDERYRAFPLHLSFFSFSTLETLLLRYGYRIIKRRNFGIGIDNCVRRDRSGKHARPVSISAATRQTSSRALETLKQNIRSAVYGLELGENLAVVARKAAAVRAA
jgi:SAM-dependent methyltransferase